MTLTQKIARRDEMLAEARARFDELQGASDPRIVENIERDHDAAMAEVDALNREIDRESKLVTAEARSRESGARPAAGTAESLRPFGGPASVAGEDGAVIGGGQRWLGVDGQEVRCLSARDRLARETWRGPELGAVMRAMVTGPRNEAEKRALAEGSDAAGGYTVPQPLAAAFIDRLRAESVLVRAGAQTIPMPSETLALARLETDPAVAWKAESAAFDAGDPTFGRVLLTARTLRGMVRMSRELADDSINVVDMLERAMSGAAAVELDRAGLAGTGTAPEPRGVLNTSGISAVDMAANGAALASYDKLVDAIFEMQAENAGLPTAAVMHPRTGKALAKLKDSELRPLVPPALVAGVPQLSTTSMPVNQVQGTSDPVASSILFGDFSKLMIGMRSELRIELLRERFADNFEYAFVFWLRADFAVAQPKAFSVLRGIVEA